MPKTYKHKTDRRNAKTKPQEVPAKFTLGFLNSMDHRTGIAKALKSNRDAIIADIGGDEEVSRVKASLIERFVWLDAVLASLENEMAKNPANVETLSRWIQGVNSLSGLAKTLGIERKARTMPWASLATVPNGLIELPKQPSPSSEPNGTNGATA